jgi:hypothetical protein
LNVLIEYVYFFLDLNIPSADEKCPTQNIGYFLEYRYNSFTAFSHLIEIMRREILGEIV